MNPWGHIGSEPTKLTIIGEVFILTEWWFAFLVMYFHLSITQFVYSFNSAESFDDKILHRQSSIK